MTRFRRVIIVFALLLPLVSLAGVVIARYWMNAPLRQTKANNAAVAGLVDQQPLITAQKLAPLATTAEEQELAQQALRLADHEIDLEFASALRKAARHPSPLPAQAQSLVARADEIEDRLKSHQKEISRLTGLIAQSDDNQKLDLQHELEVQQAMLEVEQEDLDAIRQELIAAGGDPATVIERLKQQHDLAKSSASAPRALPAQAAGESRTLLVQWRAWRHLAEVEQAIQIARAELTPRLQELARQRELLLQESSQPSASAPPADSQPSTTAAQSAATGRSEMLSIFRQVADERKRLAGLDRRADDLKQLDAVYGRWYAVLRAHEQVHLMMILEGICWTVFFLLLLIMSGPLLRWILPRLMPQNRRQHTFRIVARFALQALSLAVALLVVFGPPNQLAAVLALCGAGLTVALKDFIVAFFGWFTLMGSNGIRPGDWVEINGTGGEVLEVGLLHTVLLETGDWSDAGHPTGRKVTFVNSFAVEGHYFNFSTSGQWLWDQIEVPVPPGADPYPIAEMVQAEVREATKANMELAEKEWARATPSHIARSFTTAPDVRIQPTPSGVEVVVRYMARANERYALRTQLFYTIVEKLRTFQVTTRSLQPVQAKAATG